MAHFIRFQAGGRPALVNVEQITSIFTPIARYDYDPTKHTQTSVYDKTRTTINFSGDNDCFLIVDEPFEAVCDKLNGNVHTGTWIEKKLRTMNTTHTDYSSVAFTARSAESGRRMVLLLTVLSAASP